MAMVVTGLRGGQIFFSIQQQNVPDFMDAFASTAGPYYGMYLAVCHHSHHWLMSNTFSQ